MGNGRFAAHWTGDNGATWDYLRISIAGNFNFQIFGMPFVGADICGFMRDTTAELCARWTQVGALYPFARNHHELESRNQEPWTFNEKNLGVSVIETTKASLHLRYSILKWYYSLFVATNGTGSIFRPLNFEFPDEEILYTENFNEWEFLLGSGLLCTPKIERGEPFVQAYFPVATWYDLYTGKVLKTKTDKNRQERVPTPFNAPVPLFLRGGHILHRQNTEKVLSTEDLNDQFELVIAFDRKTEGGRLEAKGSIMGIKKYDDDSVYYRCVENSCLYDIEAVVLEWDNLSTIEIKFKREKRDNDFPLDKLGIYGVSLYGLSSFKFMTEEESRIAYTSVSLRGENDQTSFSSIQKAQILAENSIAIKFRTELRVQDGDTISMKLII